MRSPPQTQKTRRRPPRTVPGKELSFEISGPSSPAPMHFGWIRGYTFPESFHRNNRQGARDALPQRRDLSISFFTVSALGPTFSIIAAISSFDFPSFLTQPRMATSSLRSMCPRVRFSGVTFMFHPEVAAAGKSSGTRAAALLPAVLCHVRFLPDPS